MTGAIDTRRRAAPSRSPSIRRTQLVQSIAIHLLLLLGALAILFPVAWMLSTSLKIPTQINKFPPVWLPDPLVWSNYVKAVTIFPVPFWVFVVNSLVISLGAAIGTVISNAVVAYAFARLRFRGKNVLFLITLSTMMLPQQVTMIPLFILFSQLGWINTFKPLIIPNFFGAAYFIFLLRQFYTTIPRDLDDAARIDGCGFLGILWRIILPLSKPALGISAIFSFTWAWNDFLNPLIYLSRMETYPITIAISFLKSAHGILWSELMVVSFISMLPPVLLFFIAQKFYIQGIVVTGVKG